MRARKNIVIPEVLGSDADLLRQFARATKAVIAYPTRENFEILRAVYKRALPRVEQLDGDGEPS
jgi:hypothetical protein